MVSSNESMPSLTQLANKYGPDKGTAAGLQLGYSVLYEEYLAPLRDKPIRFLEIGICDPRFPGASLKMWEEYFSCAEIIGVDLVDCSRFDTDRVKTYVVDQGNPDDLDQFVTETGGNFDIIIDDGSHAYRDVMMSFQKLFPHVKEGGLYFVEDIADWIDLRVQNVMHRIASFGEVRAIAILLGDALELSSMIASSIRIKTSGDVWTLGIVKGKKNKWLTA